MFTTPSISSKLPPPSRPFSHKCITPPSPTTTYRDLSSVSTQGKMTLRCTTSLFIYFRDYQTARPPPRISSLSPSLPLEAPVPPQTAEKSMTHPSSEALTLPSHTLVLIAVGLQCFQGRFPPRPSDTSRTSAALLAISAAPDPCVSAARCGLLTFI